MNQLLVDVKLSKHDVKTKLFSRAIDYPDGVAAPDVCLLEKAMRILFDKMDVDVIFTFSRY